MNYPSGRVSVVIPCFNASAFVRQTIASVLEQDIDDLEIVVVDDGSTDGSWEIVSSFGSAVRAVRQNRTGSCAARNRGVALTSGKYVMFLDADDLLSTPDTLSSLRDTAASKGAIAYCAWSTLVMSGHEWTPQEPNLGPLDERDYLRSWIEGWFAPTCTVLWPVHIYSRLGGWDERLQANQDGDIMIRALLAGASLAPSAGGHAYYRSHGATRVSISNNTRSVEALRSRISVLEKLDAALAATGALQEYRRALGRAYYQLARGHILTLPDDANLCLKRAQELAGSAAVTGTRAHRVLSRLIGLAAKERVSRTLFGSLVQ